MGKKPGKARKARKARGIAAEQGREKDLEDDSEEDYASNVDGNGDDGQSPDKDAFLHFGDLVSPGFPGDFLRGFSLWFNLNGNRKAWQLGRICGFLALLFVEGWLKSVVRGNSLQHVGPIENMRDEIFPGLDKYGEKIDNGLEMLLKFGQFQHTQQVVKHLSWFQTFCANNGGMEGHASATWLCMLKKTEVRGLTDPVLQGQPGMDCSEKWIDEHVHRGDNTDKVPLGTMPAGMTIDDGFDEYPFMAQSPFWSGASTAIQEATPEVQGNHEEGSALSQITVKSDGHQQAGRAGRRHHFYESLARNRDTERGQTKAVEKDQEPAIPGFSGPQCADKKAREILPICRNHHWGPLIYLCRPEHVEVKFHIENSLSPYFWAHFKENGLVHQESLQAREVNEIDHRFQSSKRSFTDFNIKYTRIGGPEVGWYEGSVDITTGDLTCDAPWHHIVLAVFAVLLASRLMIEAVCSVLKTPWSLYNLLLLREPDAPVDDIWEVVRNHADVFGGRCIQKGEGRISRGNFLVEVYNENLVGLCLLVSKSVSFFVAMTDPNHCVWKHGLPVLDDSGNWMKATMYDTCERNFMEFAVQAMWTFGTDPLNWGLALIVIRVNVACRRISLLAWWPAVIIICAGKTVVFGLFFFFIICSFALYTHLAYGDRFLAFFSVQRALESLTFYCFGMVDPADFHIETFEEVSAWWLTMTLTVYQIVVSTIALNFFLVIVMNSYDVVIKQTPEAQDRTIEWKLVSSGNSVMSKICPAIKLVKADAAHATGGDGGDGDGDGGGGDSGDGDVDGGGGDSDDSDGDGDGGEGSS